MMLAALWLCGSASLPAQTLTTLHSFDGTDGRLSYAGLVQHTTLATSRLRFLFVAARIWRHAGRTGVSYSDHYEEKGVFERLMDRLRRIAPRGESYAPVMVPALR
jgi:hypothetical protein